MTTFLASAVLANADASAGGSSLFSLALLLLVPFGMYFFMIRPQRRKLREQQSLQAALGVGDEVVTTSGIFGTITGEDGDNRFWLEIDDDVQIRIARAAITGRVDPDGVDGDAADVAAVDSESTSSD